MIEKITTKEEFVKFMLLCKEFMAESRYSHRPLDAARCARVIEIAQANPHLFYVKYKVNKEGDFVGVLIAQIEQMFFMEAKQASDVVFFVREDYRGSPWFIKTLRAFELWAKDMGCDFIKLMPNSGIKTEGMLKFYTRLGYDHVGYIFSKEI